MTRNRARECTLFTGPSGLHTVASLGKLAAYAQRQGVEEPRILKLEEPMVNLHVRKFPEDPSVVVIGREGGFQHLLQEPKSYLRDLWSEGVEQLVGQLEDDGRPLFIAMHAVFHHTGNRDFFPCANAHFLCGELEKKGYRIAKVVTLVDDIYDMWKRLSEPHQLFAGTGDPVTAILDLLLILTWRSVETLAAEEIARELAATHYLLAVKHPVSVAYDLVFSQKHPVYIAHPISEIRSFQQAGRMEEAEQAQQAQREVQELTDLLLSNAQIIPFFPTAIDELLVAAEPPGSSNYVPRLLSRWPHLPPERLLFSPPANTVAGPFDLAAAGTPLDVSLCSLLRGLVQSVRMQVNSRDKKLVEQSDALVIWRPCWNGYGSGGVDNEVAHRTKLIERGCPGGANKKAVALIRCDDLGLYRMRRFPDLLKNHSATVPPPLSDEVLLQRLREGLLPQLSRENAVLEGATLQRVVDPTESITFPLTRRQRSALASDERISQREAQALHWGELATELAGVGLPFSFTASDVVLFDDGLSVPEFVGRVEREVTVR